MLTLENQSATGTATLTDTQTVSRQPPKLLDRMREAIRVKHYALATERTYIHWAKRFIFFHNKRHPAEMGAPEVESFLSALATERNVSASTQNQAMHAILFLYKDVLGINLPWLDGITRAKVAKRLPSVLTVTETQRMMRHVSGTNGLIIKLLYGTGMRIKECLRLRVKDVDIEHGQITVREGKGNKDRITMLPASLADELRAHLIERRRRTTRRNRSQIPARREGMDLAVHLRGADLLDRSAHRILPACHRSAAPCRATQSCRNSNCRVVTAASLRSPAQASAAGSAVPDPASAVVPSGWAAGPGRAGSLRPPKWAGPRIRPRPCRRRRLSEP